jgi:hypothetical protein
MTKNNLLIVCAGPGAVYERWDNYDQHNFDLAVLQWNTGPRLPNTSGAAYYENDPGNKFHMIAKFADKHDLSSYDYIWLLDDDCITTAEDVAETFDYCKQHGFDVAQPALTHESYIAHEPTKQVIGAQHHITDTVEIMCPIFSQRCWPEASALFDMLPDGTGPELEVYWRIIFESDTGTTKYGGKVAVIDTLPVLHSRPITTPDQWIARGMVPGRDSLWLQAAGYRGWSFRTIEVVY